ncbi:hypothetical protein PVK06_021747 [Gossypium arboreum]|uniref:Reverse transcriptase n=1 Tax=Gossypium arboreum TaxID=29729 RepID=A0ABR0PRM7_GOSAR|nr:hypothetical protein PVK06_021747 [Gossypium arboreum]
MGFSSNWFTWERGNLPETNIQERLDRGVATDSWLALFPDYQIRHLSHSFSDHCPLLINTKCKDSRCVERRFKFEAWWVLEESFIGEVKSIWENSSEDLLNKLQRVKRGLQKWAVRIRYSRKAKKEMLHLKLTKLLEEDRSDENLAELIDTNVDLNFEIEKDERYWEQREDNLKLKAEYTKEEIHEAFKEMGPTKAPGEDGFPAQFYQKCWSIIGEDVTYGSELN